MNAAVLGYSHPVLQNANTAARLERLEVLLRADPENLPLRRECVELSMRGGEYRRALELIDARLARHPDDSESLFARANALIGLKQFDGAIAVLKRARRTERGADRRDAEPRDLSLRAAPV